MTLRTAILALSLAIVSCAAPPAVQEGEVCMPGPAFSAQYQSGEIQTHSGFSEAPIGGARVQRQHPNTHMTGQAKYIEGNGRAGVACSYSNHVGLVAVYLNLDVETVSAVDLCETTACEGMAHWRKEWRNSAPQQDKPGQEMMYVCVRTKKTIDYPSLDCRFKSKTVD